MEQVRIKIDLFKAHSLRGATATHMLQKNVPQEWVQARGHWSSSVTLDQYYNHLHQTKEWEALIMGKDASVRLSEALAVPRPSSPIVELYCKETKVLGFVKFQRDPIVVLF